jgi:hypothetical protein
LANAEKFPRLLHPGLQEKCDLLANLELGLQKQCGHIEVPTGYQELRNVAEKKSKARYKWPNAARRHQITPNVR